VRRPVPAAGAVDHHVRGLQSARGRELLRRLIATCDVVVENFTPRVLDQIGLDVVLDIEEHYCAEHPEYPEGPRKLLRTYLQQGRLGVKSGAGFYDDYPRPTQSQVDS